MTLRGVMRGLRIYIRGWRTPPHVVFGLMFGAGAAAYGGRFAGGFVLGVLLSPCWEVAVRKGWIRASHETDRPSEKGRDAAGNAQGARKTLEMPSQGTSR
jgi:hypothetical protein